MDGGWSSAGGVPFPHGVEGLVPFHNPLMVEFLLVQEGIRLKSCPCRPQILVAWGLHVKGKDEIPVKGLLKGCLKHHVSLQGIAP